MAGGYMGRLLFINLSTDDIKEENPTGSLYRNFLIGYVPGAHGAGIRSNAGLRDPHKCPAGFLTAVTGYDRPLSKLEKIGERIGTMRHLFSLYEVDVPIRRFVHPSLSGIMPIS